MFVINNHGVKIKYVVSFLKFAYGFLPFQINCYNKKINKSQLLKAV